MKRIIWSAIGIAIGTLAVAASAASPALALEIVALTVNPTGTILPGRTAAQLSGMIQCDVAGPVTLNFLTLNQTGRNTQFINALDPNVPDTLTCSGSLQTWSYTVLVVFPISGRLHKGKAGVTVQFDDIVVLGKGYDPAHTAFATVFIK